MTIVPVNKCNNFLTDTFGGDITAFCGDKTSK